MSSKRFSKTMILSKLLGSVGLALALALALSMAAMAQSSKGQTPRDRWAGAISYDNPEQAVKQSSASASGDQASTETADQHRQLAEQYRKEAAGFHQQAESHRQMLAEYKKEVFGPPKEVGENSYIRDMRQHCERLIAKAEAAAAESEELANYHLLRAEEIEPTKIAGIQIANPSTADEHRQVAQQYQKQAADYRQQADTHRKMLADYAATVAKPPKEVGENSYIRKMRLHCERFISDADGLADESEQLARFHLLRAEELEPPAALGVQIGVPKTAAEHRHASELYDKQASEYRQQVETHRQMLEDYKKGVARSPKEVGENPYVKEMRQHCERLIQEASGLADEAEELARFHLLRAKEIEGYHKHAPR